MRKKIAQTITRLPYIKDFKHGLAWNLFDSVGTQGLLILYHVLFRKFFGTELHGKVGCTLSVFYLSVIILNLGLDYSLAPFLEYFTKSRQHFRSFLKWLIVPQLIFVSMCGLVFFIFFPQLQPIFPVLSTFGTSSDAFLISLSLALVFESMKKTAKQFLQLIFYTSLTACVDVFGMVLYIFLIFLAPLYGITVTLTYTCKALCILTGIQLLFLSAGLYAFYTTLKKTDDTTWPHLLSRISKTRIFAWSNQCINQLFSGNFLVPICALNFGFEQASLLKVITSISYWITYIAQKVFGITGNALLAHVKTRSLETQKKAFEYISYLSTQALYFLIIFLSINGKKIALLQTKQIVGIDWSLLYFMLLISFFESFFIIYEKWYILEEKASAFFLFNLLSFGLLYTLYPLTRSTVAMLVLIIALRLLTFLILTLISFYRWRIWPSLKPDLRALTLTIIISLIFYTII